MCAGDLFKDTSRFCNTNDEVIRSFVNHLRRHRRRLRQNGDVSDISGQPARGRPSGKLSRARTGEECNMKVACPFNGAMEFLAAESAEAQGQPQRYSREDSASGGP